MVLTAEQHVDWLATLLVKAGEAGITEIEAEASAEADWTTHVGELASQTLAVGCDSWQLGANVAGKPRVFMPYVGGLGRYAQHCDEVAVKGYEGFISR